MEQVVRRVGDAVTLTVKVVPRANQNDIVGVEGQALKIRLKAPPVEGKANEALVRFLAESLGVPRSFVEIVAGHSSRQKVVRIRGTSAERVEQLTAR